MTVILDTSRDLTVESLRQISRDGAACALSEAALDRVARRREEFLAFVRHNEDRLLYGITTRHHTGAKTLLDALDALDRAFRIARNIDDQSRARMPFEILQHADIQVGRDFLILRDHLGVRNIEQVVANHLAEMFVARSDHEGVRHENSRD